MDLSIDESQQGPSSTNGEEDGSEDDADDYTSIFNKLYIIINYYIVILHHVLYYLYIIISWSLVILHVVFILYVVLYGTSVFNIKCWSKFSLTKVLTH